MRALELVSLLRSYADTLALHSGSVAGMTLEVGEGVRLLVPSADARRQRRARARKRVTEPVTLGVTEASRRFARKKRPPSDSEGRERRDAAVTIAFTQFLRPDGRQQTIGIERPEPIEESAKWLHEKGCNFEIEVLRTGEVSIEVLGPKDDEGDRDTLAVEIVENGPGVAEAVDRVVEEALSAFKETQN